jgi:hypothetical protein
MRFLKQLYCKAPSGGEESMVIDHASLKNYIRESLGDGRLSGNSAPSRLKNIGPFFHNRLRRLGCATLWHLVRALLPLDSRESVYRTLTLILQNKRAGQSIPTRESPVQIDEVPHVVVRDYNSAAYISIRALLVVLADPVPRGPDYEQRSREKRIDWGFPGDRPIVPPAFFPRLSQSVHCLAACGDPDACQSATGPRGGNLCSYRNGMCVPSRRNTRSPPEVGGSSAQRRDQEMFDYTDKRIRGPYAEGWRLPVRLRAIPLPPMN